LLHIAMAEGIIGLLLMPLDLNRKYIKISLKKLDTELQHKQLSQKS